MANPPPVNPVKPDNWTAYGDYTKEQLLSWGFNVGADGLARQSNNNMPITMSEIERIKRAKEGMPQSEKDIINSTAARNNQDRDKKLVDDATKIRDEARNMQLANSLKLSGRQSTIQASGTPTQRVPSLGFLSNLLGS